MKNIITIFLLFIGLISNATTLDSVTTKVTSTVKESVHTADTSSNFRMVYQDAKEAIAGLAAALKVGAEHVYIVLVKQQVVNSTSYLIGYLIAIFLLFLGSKQFGSNWYKESYENTDPGHVFFSIGYVVLLFFSLAFVADTLNKTVMGFVNPEYGAIKDIMNFIK